MRFLRDLAMVVSIIIADTAVYGYWLLVYSHSPLPF